MQLSTQLYLFCIGITQPLGTHLLIHLLWFSFRLVIWIEKINARTSQPPASKLSLKLMGRSTWLVLKL